jgi:rod shape-determining protein MreC
VLNNNLIDKHRTRTYLRRHKIIIASALLLLFSLHLALTDNREAERGIVVKEVISIAISPVQNAILGTYGAITEVLSNYILLINLKSDNDNLNETVTRLKAENNALKEEVGLNSRLKEVLEYKEAVPFETIAATILGFNMDRWTRTVTIDKGVGDGITKDMAVITPLGVIGRVIETGPHSSMVLLSTDLRSNIEAIVQRTRVKGVIEGNGKDRLRLKYVLQLDDVLLGDRIVTSGFSGLFPKGLVLGEVVKVEKGKDNFFKEIEVLPKVDFSRLEEVLLVKGTGIKESVKSEQIPETPGPQTSEPLTSEPQALKIDQP